MFENVQNLIYISSQLTWQWSMNIIKVKLWRFEPYLGTFAMLILDGSLKWDFLDICVTTFSEYVISEIQKVSPSSFFSKCSKLNLDFKKSAKNAENKFFFWDICNWIGIVKLSLLRAGYISSDANVLTSSPNIFRFNKKDFLQLNSPGSDHWKW